VSEWFEDESLWIDLYPFGGGRGREGLSLVWLTAPEGRAALDLCCGPGRHAVPLARRGVRVTAVDRTPFLLDLRERGWGRVINTSSIGSLGNIGQANYAASKAGVIGLTRTLALEYAKFGVTVNCVAPGPVMTRMLASVPEAIREKIVARVPTGRIARPEEIAGVHAFLASEDAAFITGQVLFVDGGMSVGV